MSLFGVADSVAMSFDEHRRLRIVAPEQYLPLAAWLYTDVQPNLAVLDELAAVLRRCRQEERKYVGNGCSLDFVNNLVLLESRYETWERVVVPQSVFWPVLSGFRQFLASTAHLPLLEREPDYPEALRIRTDEHADGAPRPAVLDHTYFPRDWSEREVSEAGAGAWQSPGCLRDEATGAWSGMWRGLELAGYFDLATGEPLTYFPVIAP
ncbi:EndoU domain-containing protein [Amycolatopsis sp. K13G38]|uniref:EndoU domain-containing protein n=1 Tax=Amycolatopsis acididurans TaxID=2724524 RepID=A0ABX1JAW6_9PSEU|nr:EndoU domain-containing protein [Amycolatopsis acididurans]NKQ56901.1 EndoU domain-containing protein [Amycolatopsis acididurans]